MFSALAVDHFKPLDGMFADNVILQIKNGPMDFQVREPVSPLFGGLERTKQATELQITQEYTGQQRHLCSHLRRRCGSVYGGNANAPGIVEHLRELYGATGRVLDGESWPPLRA